MPEDNRNLSFQKKVWITTGIVALTVIVLWILKATFNVLLLIFAGVLIATFFRGLSSIICRKTKWKEPICLACSMIGTLLLIAGLFWLIGAKVQTQLNELTDILPKTIEKAKAQLNQHPSGKTLVEKISSPQSVERVQRTIGKLFTTTFGVFGDVYVVLFMGIFFTLSPGVYKKGIVHLVPGRSGKKEAESVLNKTSESLKKWLKGKIFAMVVVAVLTAIGLVIIGLPMWLALALIAGLLSFIPNFGPLIALVTAMLVALMQSPLTLVLVAGLYIVIQIVESNFITPMVQKRLINIPPALILIAQLLIAPLAGGWGLVLATPIMAALIVFIQELYIKKQNS